MASYPTPHGGASLILSFRFQKRIVLIIGGNSLAASRAFAALDADSSVVVIARGGEASVCDELKWRAQQHQLSVIDWDALPGPSSSSSSSEQDAELLEGYLSTNPYVSLVCVTDTLLSAEISQKRNKLSAEKIARVCRSRNIPVNITDLSDLCDFTFTSTHRFQDPDTGSPSPLQIGITTNGQGCRLATRLRREIISKLPKDVGRAVSKVGKLRELARADSSLESANEASISEDGAEATPNAPVPQRSAQETPQEDATRRMKWVAQVSEYWSLQRLADMSEQELADVLNGQAGLPVAQPVDSNGTASNPDHAVSLHGLSLTSTPPKGRIFLVGSGPGHPSLLTIATHSALTRHADLVLSDKLVPAAVLALIPKHVEVRIARKFPGNADGAQQELMEAGVEAARRGLTVVRLKQGDPTVYGRAGEEVLYFRAHGFEPIVVPGVTSALAGPIFAGIPVTQRGAAESFIVCTGVGRRGKEVKLPGYERSRTLVMLMGVARLPQVLVALQSEDAVSARNGPAYPPNTPIALIERGSMPDQRVIYSTLRDIVAALDSVGEQRPPGMLVIGWSIISLFGKGDMTILDDDASSSDEARLRLLLGEAKWKICEGIDEAWNLL
ncbi:hypothetical protein QCA50_002318 [Cerrena zonata]|uniref:precorrin-2 dehydrogenase n=1 Tax=Cerrena zonata TaxID=2478898 RepID=A0AAW0GNC9_9APHY